MNTCREIIFLALMLSILPGCSHSSDKTNDKSTDRTSQCDYATRGELDTKVHKSDDSSLNSYLLICALDINVPLVDESKQSIKQRNRKKLKIADFLMTQKLDLDYVDDTGSTLLMVLVISDTPHDWKLRAAEALLQKGADIQIKNKYGKTALDLAEFTANAQLIDLLSKNRK
jgi:ankyrin repeat protein